MEIWNNVFMEFYRDEKWNFTKLSQHNVDTGMWFERLCKVLQWKESIYETDLFAPFISLVEKTTGVSYKGNERKIRIVADHLRTAFMLINDWLTPSNVWAWYVLRMIIRRCYYNLILLKKLNEQELSVFIDEAFVAFKGLREFGEDRIKKVLLNEISQFEKTITKWEWILNDLLKSNKRLSWEQIFMLYDTYGFPLEITKEIATAKGVELDLDGYKKALEDAKEKSRQSTKAMFQKTADWSKYLEGIPATQFVGYDSMDYQDSKLLKEIDIEDWQKILIFDKTPFYPEMWWQNGDSWNIKLDDWREFIVSTVQKTAWVILHFVR